LVLRRQCPEISEDLELSQRLRQIQMIAPADLLWNRGIYQLIEGSEAEGFQHLGDVFLVGTYVSGNEGFGGWNRGVNVLDCGAHRSDNLTPYALMAQFQPLASSLCSAARRRREYGARQRLAVARRSHRGDRLLRLFLEPSDALLWAESASPGVLRFRETARRGCRCRQTPDGRPRHPAPPRSHLQRHRPGECCGLAAGDLHAD